jgi:sulfide dehydrogenase cytochrome subunit
MSKRVNVTVTAAVLTMVIPLAVSAASGPDLAEQCAGCHGKDGNSDKEAVPNIAGFSTFYLVDTMTAYRAGDRPGKSFRKDDGTETNMNEVAKDLTDDDLEALGAYYAEQTFKSHADEQKTDPAMVSRGEKLFHDGCRKCHSDFGSDPGDDAGLLAGQWMPYLRGQFELFASGDRYMPRKMSRNLEPLSKDDQEAIIQALGSK